MTVVSNTSPLIALSLIDRFSIMFDLFETINISSAVHQEIKEEPAQTNVPEAYAQKRIQIIPPLDQSAVQVLQARLDKGESETIILAKQLGADFVLMDETNGRKTAIENALTPFGTVGLIKLWCDQTGESIEPLLDNLKKTGFWISPHILRKILK
jgi:uncharacterized protein